MRFALLLCLIAALLKLSPQTTEASTQEPPPPELSLLAQRSTSIGLEQVALLFFNDRAVTTRNSNFMRGPEKTVMLGEFRTSLNTRLSADRKTLDQVLIRLKREASGDYPAIKSASKNLTQSESHQIRWFLNTYEIDSGSPYFAEVSAILESVQDISTWQANDGISIGMQGKDVSAWSLTKKERTPLDASACMKVAAALRCNVTGFGTAYLKIP
jgi:hypothetical protein